MQSWLKQRHAFLFWCAISLIALIAVLITVPVIGTQQLGFDEGWNLQAPYELATEGKYASFGAVFDGQTKIFDPYLSTGPAVSIPIAIVYKLFGIGVEQSRVVMLAFYVAALYLLAWYAYMQTKSMFALLAPLAMLLVVSSGITFRTEILGEIPAVAYGLASLIAWRRGVYWLAGTLAVLAMLSKFLMLLLVVAGCLAFVLLLIRRWRKWRTVVVQGLQWTAGVAVPLILWELLRFVQLDGTGAAYKENLLEFGRVFKANGSGVSASGTAGLTFSDKLDLLLANIMMPKTLMILATGLLLLGMALGYRRFRAALSANLYGLLFVSIYAIWWFGLSNGGYTRYTVPLVLVIFAIVLHMYLYMRPAKPQVLRWVGTGLTVGLLAIVGWSVWTMPYRISVQSSLQLAQQKHVATMVKAAQPQNLTHIGWWQNPEIQFLSGLHTRADRHLKPGDSYDLLLSPAMREIVPQQYTDALLLCNQGVLFENSGYVLCKGIKQ